MLPSKRYNNFDVDSFLYFEPSEGPMGKDGIECPAHCPANCGMEEMMCPGGEDPNGCMMPESCIPSKGTILIFALVV